MGRTRNYAAEIYEALGRHDIAASLRWAEPTQDEAHLREIADLNETIAELREEIKHADEMLKGRVA